MWNILQYLDGTPGEEQTQQPHGQVPSVHLMSALAPVNNMGIGWLVSWLVCAMMFTTLKFQQLSTNQYTFKLFKVHTFNQIPTF